MTGKEIAAKLREALALMNDEGAHWIQGQSMAETDHGRKFCSIGAIRYVLTGDPWRVDEEESQVAEYVARAIPSFREDSEMGYDDQIVGWNDSDNRNWEDIVKAFTKAAEAAEAQA